MHRILVGIFLLFSMQLFGQSIEIKGKVVEAANKSPLESVTVYMNRVKDSSLVNYSITDKNGNFTFKIDKQTAPTVLRASFVSFATYEKSFASIESSIDLGLIQLEEDNMLDEVVVRTETPPIRIKNDTIEFNAASFRVRPDANVETLIKQLPGVEIDADGKITHNGKEVKQFLVNGKPFFDKDGKIALQSLPAEIINKVQVTDQKTKREEQTGQASSSNSASINLTIDEEKNKGLFGRVVGGYGTDERYETSAMVNYFKKDFKVSVLAMANNINSTGFSMDEIFDNMGGGRSGMRMFSVGGSNFINGMNFGGGQGITESWMVGLNVSDKIFGEQEFSGSYFVQGNTRKNDNRSSSINFLPTGNFLTESTSNTVTESTSHRVNTQLEGQLGKEGKLSYTFTPSFNSSTTTNEISRTQGRWEETGRQTQESTGYTSTAGENQNVNIELNTTYKFAKKNSWLSVDIETGITHNDQDNYTRSDNYFYYDTNNDGTNDDTVADLRNQMAYENRKNNSVNAFIEYSIPVLDSLRTSLNLEYKNEKSTEDKQTYDFNAGSQEFTSLNDELTRYNSLRQSVAIPQFGVHWMRSKSTLNVLVGTQIAKMDGKATYLGEKYQQERTFTTPYAHVNYRYSFSRSKNFWMNYTYETDGFTADQWLPVVDLSNPQQSFVGNPDLELPQKHDAYLTFRNFDFGTRSGYFMWLGGTHTNNRIVSYTIYDESQRAETTYRNIDGVYSIMGGLSYSWNKKFGEAHKWRFGTGLRMNYNHNEGFINGELYKADTRSFTPTVEFSYDYGEIFTIQPRYSVSIENTGYTNFTRSSTSNTRHNVTTQATLYWPKNFTLGNDFSYTYNTAIANGYQKGFYLWNVSLGYSFWKDQLLAKVKVYDLLDQNVSATRTISENGIFDAENTVLRQYVMFSLTYKFNKFGSPVKNERPRRVMGHF